MESADDETLPARLRTTPSWLLFFTAAQAQRLMWAGMALLDVRRYHYALLAALEEFGPSSQAALGRRVGIDRSDVVAAINELVEQGLVDRTLDATDRRRNTITITAAGRRHLQRLDEMLAGVQEEFLAPLSTEERGKLMQLLTRVFDHHARG
jgi:MarR family transcriptional regulator, lower aerobic nicotinate degradation pathway regulator